MATYRQAIHTYTQIWHIPASALNTKIYAFFEVSANVLRKYDFWRDFRFKMFHDTCVLYYCVLHYPAKQLPCSVHSPVALSWIAEHFVICTSVCSNGCPSQPAPSRWLWLAWQTQQGSGSQLQLKPSISVRQTHWWTLLSHRIYKECYDVQSNLII